MNTFYTSPYIHDVLNCSTYSGCNSCVDTESCYWCTSNSKCVDKFDSTSCSSSSDEVGNGSCSSNYYTVIFIVIICVLACLCCATCWIRRLNFYRNNGDGIISSYLTPLLPNGSLWRNSTQIDDTSDTDWMCVICGFDNKCRNQHCTLCGTTQKFTSEYKSEKEKRKTLKSINRSKTKSGSKRLLSVDIPIPDDAQLCNSETINALLLDDDDTAGNSCNNDNNNNNRMLNNDDMNDARSSCSSVSINDIPSIPGTIDSRNVTPIKVTDISRTPTTTATTDYINNQLMWSQRPSLSPAQRRDAFNYRRLNQLSLRQKEARRRKMWLRNVDLQTGELKWIRVPFADNFIKNNNSDSNAERDSEKGSEASYRSSYVVSRFSDVSQQLHYNNERSDSFGDSTLYSSSPGFTSVLDENGRLSWERVESGKIAARTKIPKDKGWNSNPVYKFNTKLEDLEAVAASTFKDKQKWFNERMATLQKPWSDGCVRVDVSRKSILQDSFEVVRKLELNDLHKWIRIVFTNEPGIDAGGLEREWFLLLTDAIFEPTNDLFTCSARNSSAGQYHINPNSRYGILGDQHLLYYRFIGRYLGKALMEQQSIAATLSLPLRKQILSLPITFSDLEFVDDELFRNLSWLKKNDNVDTLSLDFTVTYSSPGTNGVPITYELKPGGSLIAVTDENKEEYLQLRLRHRMLDSIKPQLECLLHGIYEIIPPDLLVVFDYQELDLLMCGLPDIDVSDWIKNTEYLGEYSKLRDRHRVIRWFWLAVESFSREEKVRLLQFTTGCARLPAQGFKFLMSNDGNYRKFNIQSISKKDSLYPRSHTCFNKLDLPMYDSQAELDAYLSMVISLEVTGFTIE